MSADMEQLAGHVVSAFKTLLDPLLARIVQLEARPVAQEGPQGPTGADGAPGPMGPLGPVGPPGAPGVPGRDGRDGVPGERGLDGQHGKDGAPGKDGADGLGFDDLDVAYDGARTVTLSFTRGERVKTFPLTMPIVLDQGVYQQGTTYQKGDGVTWGGSFWIAQAETDAKPGEGATPWRLAVKAGREGKAGRDGKDLRDAPVVRAVR